ncbi:acyl-CoA dehydrogenase family protein [Micromonospora sp. BRA006-A]|nr:acyl-CoA dehydrogenase family protein [Micromonospora sp. BRA006-A]
MADLGWLGLSLPEEFDGGGAGMTELCLFLEETSRAMVPSAASPPRSSSPPPTSGSARRSRRS